MGKFFFSQCSERDQRFQSSFYDLLVSLTFMNNHFMTAIIGNVNYLNLVDELIRFSPREHWFSLYEADLPSYYICYNTEHTNNVPFGAVLELEINELDSFL